MIHPILPEQPQHAEPVDQLLDHAFGPQRLAKAVYTLREGVAPIRGLSHVIEDREGALLASLRFWPVRLPDGSVEALLGPIAVRSSERGAGHGSRLIEHGIMRSRAIGYRVILLVGDLTYYGKFGFAHDPARWLRLPGLDDHRRLLALELKRGRLSGLRGTLMRAAP